MNGILIINKPKQYTSHDVVAKVKKICQAKVGHAGTLDPIATGVLPLLIGEGTKLSEYLTNHDKVYEATLKLGIKTDTADGEGKILETQEVKEESIEQKNVEKVLASLIGKQKQTPPMYSAIKVNGKKLYEYARLGQKVDVLERDIEIYNMELLKIEKNKNCISFKVHCSKGTYIRSLCEEIAKKLNTIGFMKDLKRVKVGEFSIEEAVTIEQIELNKNNMTFWENNLITIQKFFNDLPCLHLDEQKIKLLINGVQLTMNMKDGLYQIKKEDGKWLGTATILNGRLKRKLIIQQHLPA